MFDVGFAELFLLSLIGLLILGPERLPAVARTLGGFVRKARVSYYNLKRTVEAELAAAEAANPIKEAQKELESVQKQVKELGDKLDENQIAPEQSSKAQSPKATAADDGGLAEDPGAESDASAPPATGDEANDKPAP
jgi:sec-independent protein translocase protein TatB